MRTRPPSVARVPLWFYAVAAVSVGSLISWGVFLYDRPPVNGGLPSSDRGAPATHVEVQGFDLIISYWTAGERDPSYFESPECTGCPENLTPSSDWRVSLFLSNSDPTQSHEISNLTVLAPFTTVVIGPTLPCHVAPGENVTLQLDLRTPSEPGSYFLTGAIGTS